MPQLRVCTSQLKIPRAATKIKHPAIKEVLNKGELLFSLHEHWFEHCLIQRTIGSLQYVSWT